jgi:L-alanine-DL-glutamate epimerase-like enolase superfamily enzyme
VEPLTICGDVAQVPTGPGLGVEVDEAKVQRLLMPLSFPER